MVSTKQVRAMLKLLREQGITHAKLQDNESTVEFTLGPIYTHQEVVDTPMGPDRNICSCGHSRANHGMGGCLDCVDTANCDSIDFPYIPKGE